MSTVFFYPRCLHLLGDELEHHMKISAILVWHCKLWTCRFLCSLCLKMLLVLKKLPYFYCLLFRTSVCYLLLKKVALNFFIIPVALLFDYPHRKKLKVFLYLPFWYGSKLVSTRNSKCLFMSCYDIMLLYKMCWLWEADNCHEIWFSACFCTVVVCKIVFAKVYPCWTVVSLFEPYSFSLSSQVEWREG